MHFRRAALLLVFCVVIIPAAQAEVSISNKPTQNMGCDAGVCTATARKAVLNVGDLQKMLASGDVAVKTGTVAKDIDFDQPLSWSSISRLTLDAQQSVTVNRPVSVAGSGALTIVTDDGGSGGDLYFFGKGKVNFSDVTSSLIINGTTFTLVNDLTELGADVVHNPSGAYALAASYDAKGEKFRKAPVATTFSGIFEGLGNSVSNTKVKHGDRDCAGVFVTTTATAIIRDIAFKKIRVFSDAAFSVGGLVGCNNGSTILDATVDGSVQGGHDFANVGGLVGNNEGVISRSRSSATVSGTGKSATVGGLVGDNSYVIDQCFATGPVLGTQRVGGLVGYTLAYVSNSFATGSSDSSASAAGGFAGAIAPPLKGG